MAVVLSDPKVAESGYAVLEDPDGGAHYILVPTKTMAGIDSGELCPMDPLQAIYSILGPNVFYFLSAPMMQLARPRERASLHRTLCHTVQEAAALGARLRELRWKNSA